MTKRNSSFRKRSGAAAMELAILLPFVAALFLIALDFSRVFQCMQVLDSAAEIGAKYASGHVQKKSAYSVPPLVMGPSPEAVTWGRDAALQEGARLNPPLASENISIEYQNGAAVVTVTYAFKTNYLGVPKTLNLARTVKMPLAP